MDDLEDPESQSSLAYSIAIGENLHQRIDKHLYLLKTLGNESCTKQQWLLTALKEKLEDASNSELPKERHLQIKFDHKTNKELESKIEFIRNFRRSYSKKQLVLEAIYDKLDREEEKSKNLLMKIKNLKK